MINNEMFQQIKTLAEQRKLAEEVQDNVSLNTVFGYSCDEAYDRGMTDGFIEFARWIISEIGGGVAATTTNLTTPDVSGDFTSIIPTTENSMFNQEVTKNVALSETRNVECVGDCTPHDRFVSEVVDDTIMGSVGDVVSSAVDLAGGAVSAVGDGLSAVGEVAGDVISSILQ